MRGAFTELPGTGKKSKGSLAPRKQLVPGGRTLTNRIYVLIGQISHLTPEVQRSAVQELALLASASDASRLEILAAGGDKQLIRLLQRCEVPAVQRSCLGALASLAADEWSRRRQQHALARAHVLLGADEGTAQDAAKLLANLVRSPAMQDAVHRIGAYARLQEVMSRNPADPAFDGLLTPRALVSSQPLSPIRSRPILESVPWDPLKKEEPPEEAELGTRVLMEDRELALLGCQHKKVQQVQTVVQDTLAVAAVVVPSLIMVLLAVVVLVVVLVVRVQDTLLHLVLLTPVVAEEETLKVS